MSSKNNKKNIFYIGAISMLIYSLQGSLSDRNSSSDDKEEEAKERPLLIAEEEAKEEQLPQKSDLDTPQAAYLEAEVEKVNKVPSLKDTVRKIMDQKRRGASNNSSSRTIIFSNKNGFKTVNKKSRDFELDVDYEEIHNISVSQYVENNLVNLSLVEQYIFIMDSPALQKILKNCLPSFNMNVMESEICMDIVQYYQLDTGKYKHLKCGKPEHIIDDEIKVKEPSMCSKKYQELCSNKWIDDLKSDKCNPPVLELEKKENLELDCDSKFSFIQSLMKHEKYKNIKPDMLEDVYNSCVGVKGYAEKLNESDKSCIIDKLDKIC